MTRLRLATDLGRGTLDGGWWPRSRDLVAELAELAAELAPEFGAIVRVEVSPDDWDDLPSIARPFPDAVEGAHRIDLQLSPGTTLRLLVVPPELTPDQGDEALLAAATYGYRHSAESLLETVREHPDVDPRDRWLG